MSIEKIGRWLILTDGRLKRIPNRLPMTELRTMIGAESVDTVSLRHLGLPLHVMLVDDLGHTKQLPVNAEATRLYHANCRPGAKHEIRGDVVVVPDEDFA